MPKVVNTLPFSTDINLTGSFEEYQLIIDIKGKQPGSHLEDMQDILSNFFASVNAGMFPGAKVPPIQSFVEVISSDVGSGGVIAYKCRAQGIDLGAYLILLHMVAQSHYTHEPLTHVGLKSLPSSGEEGLGLEKILACALPGRVDNAPFPVVIEKDLPKNKEPIIRIDFDRPLQDDEVEKVGEVITIWESIVILGGFFDTFEDVKDLQMSPGEFYMASPSMAENTIYEFQAPVEAFNAVINMAVKLHFTFCPVVSLELH